MKKRFFVFGVILIMSIFLIAPMSSAITLSFDPLAQDVFLGNQADVDLKISGLGGGMAPSLGVFDLYISFNPMILAPIGATFGDPVWGDQLDPMGWGLIDPLLGPITDYDDSTPGIVGLFELSLEDADILNAFQPDSFIFATLTFDTLALGSSPLEIRNDYVLGDEWGFPLSADLEPGSISVVPVIPEPATFLLLVTGLMGLGYLKKRRF